MERDINKLLEKHSGLIYKQLGKFYLSEDQEAISLGYEALYNALLTFEDKKGFTFSTYATVCIYNALGGYIRKLHRKKQLYPISLNLLMYNEDGKNTELLDTITDGVDLERDLVEKELSNKIHTIINDTIASLNNSKHQGIISEWYASNFEMPTTLLAKKYDMSQSYASQIISNFKARIKKNLEGII